MNTEVAEGQLASDVAALTNMLARFDFRDLSHTLEEGMPFFPTHSRFYHMAASRGDDPAMMFQVLMHEHCGTHVDAPAHYIREGPDPARHFLHSVPANALIGQACLLNVSDAPPEPHESPHFLKDSCWPYFAAKS